MNLLDRLLDGDLMPHGQCLLWRGDLLFLHLSGDILTTLSYFTIPVALVYLVRQRDDFQFNWIFIMFALFIFFCGTTHLMSIINIWHGYYFIAGLAKMATGLISAVTVFMIWRLVPRVLAIPTQQDLHDKVEALQRAESRLAESNQLLELKVQKRTEQLEQLARTDELTGAYNRRHILSQLASEIERFKRYGNPLTIQVIDIDNFKSINDKFGHVAGDVVLEEFARFAIKSIRDVDVVGRIGGEEFLIILPLTDLTEAESLAERLRLSLSEMAVEYDAMPMSVTCSIGVACMTTDDTAVTLLHRADRAMYAAKAGGKNRVHVAS